MSGVALCRLPTQLCEGCGDACPDEELDTLRRHTSELYCQSCRFDAQKRADATADEDHYGA